jgi:hypothetical protein
MRNVLGCGKAEIVCCRLIRIPTSRCWHFCALTLCHEGAFWHGRFVIRKGPRAVKISGCRLLDLQQRFRTVKQPGLLDTTCRSFEMRVVERRDVAAVPMPQRRSRTDPTWGEVEPTTKQRWISLSPAGATSAI